LKLASTVEAAYALMTGSAGIGVPRTRLFKTPDGGRYFGAERFDREGNLRVHMAHAGRPAAREPPRPVQEVRSAVREWPAFARATGVSAATMRRIEEIARRHGGTAMK
jgi:hypothetical protein